MSSPATALRPPRGSADAIVRVACALVVSSMGCIETVSLGSGVGEGGSGGEGTTTIPAWTTTTTTGLEDITVGGTECQPGLTTDLDGDGWTPAQGDCNDCDPDMGPSAVEMPTDDGDEPRDEDCDGEVDEPQAACDTELALDDTKAMSAARAMDLCQIATGGKWGVGNAAWMLSDGSTPQIGKTFAIGHGIVERFGPNVPVRYGKRMLALSTGTARQPTDPDYLDPRGYDKGYSSQPLDGFSMDTPTCPGAHAGQPHDSIALELEIQVPQNAEAFAFDFDFYSFELPEHVCTERDDLFLALVRPAPPGFPTGNVAFDALGNAISVNTVSLEACSCTGGPPCGTGAHPYACSLGATPLLGTGFGSDTSHDGDRGATGWLTSEVPVERAGHITLRLSIQDAEDGHFDSTVLLDHFRWLAYGDPVSRTLRNR